MTPLAGRRVTVLGGAGFAGHHLALALARAGSRVEAVDDLRHGNLLEALTAPADAANRGFHLGALAERVEALAELGVRLHTRDARDPRGLAEILRSSRPEIVIHAAAARAGDPHASFDHGLRSLDAALEASRAHGSHVVYLSADLVYGRASEPACEPQPASPTCAEGARHEAAEAWLRGVARATGRAYSIVRTGPLYGPRAAGSGRVARLVEAALAGDGLEVPDEGRGRRDFTHAEDLAAGVLLLLRDPEAGRGVWNLSYGHARSSLELARLVGEYFPGAHVEQVATRGATEPTGIALDVEKARRRLGFAPRWSLESGVASVVREHLDRCGPGATPTAPASRRRRRRGPWSGAGPALGPPLR